MTELAEIIGPLAQSFFGEPNRAMSSEFELRYGARGSLSVDLRKGTWFDHEADEGGGVLDLVTREKGLTGEARLDWLKRNGFLSETVHTNGSTPPRGKIVATYDYVDEGGELLFQVCRLQPKDFRQRKPDGNGGWSWTVKGIKRVPYKLPDLVETGDKVVFIVEGERDVDRLWSIGIPATCNAGGAGKWHPELSEYFRGCDVVVIPDRDPQKKHPKTGELMFHPDGRPILPGQDHAQAVAQALSGIAARVRVFELWQSWPGMPMKGDISDWIEHGGTAEQLYALIAQAPDWTPEQAKPNGDDQRKPLDPERRALLVSAWRKRELPGRDYLLENVFCTTSRWLISGDTGIGKTLFANELGFAMGASANFLNWHGVARSLPPRIMYLDGEMPAETMKERIEEAATIYGDVSMYVYNRDDLGPDAMPPLNRPEGQKWLWHEIETVKPDVIVFDSLMCLLAWAIQRRRDVGTVRAAGAADCQPAASRKSGSTIPATMRRAASGRRPRNGSSIWSRCCRSTRPTTPP